MDRFIARRNIERFRRLLEMESDDRERTILKDLLNCERSKLDRLLAERTHD